MATIDEKIVELRLDNSEFNKESDKTISKLEALKKSFNFDNASKSFDEINDAADKVSFNPISEGIETVKVQFNALGIIADTVLRSTVSKAVGVVERQLKALTIDNVTAGWSKYEDKMEAVQTIMSATSNQFEDTGKQMDYVSSQLDKLNWFTDETSYHFLDMVQNIGKFTANEIPLDDAVIAMQGISTWAARAGANAATAGRAMYNLSQAVAVGSVKLIDWRSIENANMATAEFKQSVLETAEELGVLQKTATDTWEIVGSNNKQVSIKDFTSNLSEGWFDSQVLMKTLDKYGGFAIRLQDMYDALEGDVTTASLIQIIDDYVDGTLDMDEALTITGMSAEELTKWLEELGSEEMALGRASFKAAQESKTLSDVLGYVVEAVSTGWMKTFEHIFGDYEESKAMWSDFSDALYDVFVASGDMRNGVLEDWATLGGRAHLIDGIANMLSNLWSVISAVKDAFRDIFPRKTGEELYSMTRAFENLMEILTPSPQLLETIQRILNPLFVLMQKITFVIGTIFKALTPIWGVLYNVGQAVVAVVAELADLLGFSLDSVFSAENLTKVYNTLNGIATVIADIANGALLTALQGIQGIRDFLKSIYDNYTDTEGGISGFISAIGQSIQDLLTNLSNGEGKLSSIFTKIATTIKNALNTIFGAFNVKTDGIESTFSGLATFVRNLSDSLLQSAAGIGKSSTAIIDKLTMMIGWLANGLEKMGIKDVADVAVLVTLATTIRSFGKMANEIGWTFSELTNKIRGSLSPLQSLASIAENTYYAQIALVIVAIANALAKLSEIPTEKLGVAAAALGIAMGAIVLLQKSMEKTAATMTPEAGKSLAQLSANLLAVTVAISVISGAMSKFSEMSWEEIGKGLAGLSGIMAELAAFSAIMQAIGSGGSLQKASVSVMTLAVGLTAMTAPVAILGSLSAESLIKGLAGIGVLLLEVSAAAAIVQNIKVANLTLASVAMMLMAAGLLAMTPAVTIMGNMELEDLVKGLAAVGLLLAGIVASAAILQNIKTMSLSIAAAGMKQMAEAIAILSVPVLAMGSMDLASLAKGVGATIVLIAALGTALGVLGTVLGVGGAIAATVIAADMVIMSGAIIMLATAMLMFNGLKPEALALGLAAILGSLLAFAGVAVICQFAAGGVVVLTGALLGIAAAIAIVIGSIKDVINSITNMFKAIGTFGEMVIAIMALSSAFGDELPSAIDRAMDTIQLIISRFLDMLMALSPQFGMAMTSLIGALVVALLASIPVLTNAVGVVFLAFLEVIAGLAGPIMDALVQIVEDLTEKLPRLINAIGAFIEELFAGLGDILFDAFVGLIAGLFNAVGLGWIGDKIRDWAHKEGGSGVKAFVEGAESEHKDAMNSYNEMGEEDYNAYGNSFRKAADINSPSGDMRQAAEEMGEGFHQGNQETVVPQMEEDGEEAATSFLDSLVGTLNSGEGKVSDAVNNIMSMLGMGKKISPYSDIELQYIDEYRSRYYERAKDMSDEEIATLLGIRTTQIDWGQLGEEDGTDYGTGLDEGMATSLTSSTKASKATTEKAKTITEQVTEIYKDRFDAFDLSDKEREADYKLWEAMNENLKTTELKMKELDNLNAELATQMEREALQEEQYNEIARRAGEHSEEARKARIEWIDQQTATQELKNQINQTSQEIIEAEAQLLEDELALDEETLETNQELWEALNKDVATSTKNAKQLQYQYAKVSYQAKRVANAEKQWRDAIASGAYTEAEIAELHNKYIKEQIEYIQLQDDLTAAQLLAMDNNAELVEQINKSAEDAEYGFTLWSKLHKDATEAEQAAMEVAKAQSNLDNQVALAQILGSEWKKAVMAYGEDSAEATEAHKAYLSSLGSALDAQNELNEKQKEAMGDQSEAFKNYATLMRQETEQQVNYDKYTKLLDEVEKAQSRYNTAVRQFGEDAKATKSALDDLKESQERLKTMEASGANKMSLRESLLQQGFSVEEVDNYFKEQAGIAKQAADETVDYSAAAMQKSAEDILGIGLDAIANLEDLSVRFAEVGGTFATEIGNGVQNASYETMNTAAGAIIDVASGLQTNEEIASGFNDVGYFMDMGIVEGVQRGQSEVVDAIVAVVMEAILAAKRAAGISSPSRITEWMGQMLDLGLIGGLENDAYNVVKASQKVMQQSVDAMARVAHTSSNFEFAGSMIADGIARGYSNYSVEILKVSSKLLQDLSDDVDEAIGGEYDDRKKLFEALGFDETNTGYEIVVDLDTSKAYEEMTALEKALYDFDNLKSPSWSTSDEEWREQILERAFPKDYEEWRKDQKNFRTASGHRPQTEEQWQAEYQRYLQKQAAALQSGIENGAYKGIVDALKEGMGSASVGQTRTEYTQNIYSPKPLSALDVYRNTTKALAKFQS